MTINGNMVMADEGKVIRLKGAQELLGVSIYIDDFDYYDSSHNKYRCTYKDFDEVEKPEDWDDSKSIVTDTDALNIITSRQ